MVSFRQVTVIFFALILVCLLVNFFLWSKPHSLAGISLPLAALILFIFYSVITLVLAFFPASGFYLPVLTRGNTLEKTIALTFDDGPVPGNTELVLDVLKRHGVSGTFFCKGRNVAAHPSLAKRIAGEGHLLGNHTFSHSPFIDLFPTRRIALELERTDKLISGITGRTPLFFRPPYGVINPMVAGAVKTVNRQTVCWSVRSFDTMNRTPEKTMRRIISRLKPGVVILLHDHTPFTRDHLDELITAIFHAGYSIAALDKLLNTEAYA